MHRSCSARQRRLSGCPARFHHQRTQRRDRDRRNTRSWRVWPPRDATRWVAVSPSEQRSGVARGRVPLVSGARRSARVRSSDCGRFLIADRSPGSASASSAGARNFCRTGTAMNQKRAATTTARGDPQPKTIIRSDEPPPRMLWSRSRCERGNRYLPPSRNYWDRRSSIGFAETGASGRPRKSPMRSPVPTTTSGWPRSSRKVAMIETGGDRGHAPARRVYRKARYTAPPTVRFLKALSRWEPSP
jgi:hypothetical protein